MSSFKSSALSLTNKLSSVTPTLSGDLTLVARSGRVVTFNGVEDQTVAYLSDISGSASPITITSTDNSVEIVELNDNFNLSVSSFVASVSGALQSEIDAIDLSAYTPLTTTSAISGDLQTQINNIVEEGTSIASSGGSILVHQNGTAFNLEVASAPIQNHNDLNGLNVGEYIHLTSAQASDFIGKTEVASISGALNTSIGNEVTNRTNADNLLQGQISDLVSVTGTYLIASDLDPYTPLTTTASISGALDTRIDLLEVIKDDTNEPNGFVNRTDSTLYYTPASATFAISGNYSIYLDGNKFNKFGDSVTLTPAYGAQYIYYQYNAGTFTVSPTLFDIARDAPIAYVFFNNGATDSILFEERHGITMDGVTHEYLHRTQGAKFVSGMTLGDYVLNSDTVANNKYSIAAGTFYDEDILNATSALADNGPYTIFYRTGASGNWTWRKTEAYPYFIDDNSIRYNQFTGGAWQLTDITTNNRWVNYYVFATNSVTPGFGYVIIPGQTIYTSLANAQAEGVANLSLGNLPFAEIVPVARVTHQFATGYANANGRARIVAVASLTATSFVSAIATASNHNSLSGLQGGTPGEYYHLTAAQSDDFIGRSEVTSVSGALVTLIDSGDSILQGQIDNIVSVTGSYLIASDLEPYTLLTTTESISGDLQGQINLKQNEITLVAGTNVTITEDPVDTWTIDAAGASGATTLDELTDVIISDPQDGHVLQYGAGVWENAPLVTYDSIASLIDVSLTDLAQGDFLFYEASSSLWKNTNMNGFVEQDELTTILLDYTLLSTTASISGDLQGQIDAIVQEGTSIASSGGSILVHQLGNDFNLELSPVINGPIEIRSASGNGQPIYFTSAGISPAISGAFTFGPQQFGDLLTINDVSGGFSIRGHSNSTGGVEIEGITREPLAKSTIFNSSSLTSKFAPVTLRARRFFDDAEATHGATDIGFLFVNGESACAWMTHSGIIMARSIATIADSVVWTVGDATVTKTAYGTIPNGFYIATALDNSNSAWRNLSWIQVSGTTITVTNVYSGFLTFTSSGDTLQLSNSDRSYGNTIYVRLLCLNRIGDKI